MVVLRPLFVFAVFIALAAALSSVGSAHHGPGDHDCGDFSTWIEAQTFFLAAGGPVQDPHGLDADGDGIACEGFINAPQNPMTATAMVPTVTTSRTVTPTSTSTATSTPTVTATATRTATVTLTAGAAATPATRAVTIVDFAFQPQSLTINVGETVRWTNDGFAAHNAIRNGMFDSGTLLHGQSFAFTFTTPGVFPYSCTIHGFSGTITVVAPAISGRGFTLQSGGSPPSSAAVGPRGAVLDRVLSWQPGGTSSLLLRWSPEHGFAVVGSRPPGASNIVDNAPLTDPVYCYVLLAYVENLSNPIVLGISPLLCLYPGTNSGTQVPGSFRVRLDETNMAILVWGAPGAQTNYQLQPTLLVDGSEPTGTTLGAGELQATFLINAGTCFQLTAFNLVTPLGSTDKLCAVPGIAVLPAAGASASRLLTTLDSTIRAPAR